MALLDEANEVPDADAIASWWKQINEWRERHAGRYDKNESQLMKPQEVIEAIWAKTNGDAYITSDVGQHQMFAAQYYK